MIELIPKWAKLEAGRRACFTTIEPSGEQITLGVVPLDAGGLRVLRTFRRAEYDETPDACWRSILAEHAALRRG